MVRMLADGSRRARTFAGDESPQELDGPALGPRSEAPGPPLEERRVPALPDEFGTDPRGQIGRIGQRHGWDDRVVERVDEQRRAPDPAQIRSARGARPVVALVREA